VRRSTHVPEQLVSPLVQTHAPLKHCVPPVHLVPQVPQLAGSVWVSVQPMLHEVRPVVQAAVQVLAEQSGVVPLHFVPHAPQLSGSLVVSTHAPEQATVEPLHVGLPPVPVVPVLVVPVLVVPVPPVPVVEDPPVPVAVVLVLVCVAKVPPPHPAAVNPVVPAKSDTPKSQEVRAR
jgi:hypothetical protein